MSNQVKKNNHSISQDTIETISSRYKRITKALNRTFWDSNSDVTHSFYVGSYGRGTAIDTSDLDVLFVLPDNEYDHFSSLSGNGPSRLLQSVKGALLDTYPNTSIKADGQVVVVTFSDGMVFEILPAFENKDYYGNSNGTYRYPDSNMGGNWKSTDPKAEQYEMYKLNDSNHSNGLLFATCKHIRYIKSEFFNSYHLSGILIDSFVYKTIGRWRFLNKGEESSGEHLRFEEHLLKKYNELSFYPTIFSPGSNQLVDTKDWDALGKVLKKMVE